MMIIIIIKKAAMGLLICAFMLLLVSGCTKKAVSEDDILKKLESTLETQGFSVHQEGKQSSDAIEQVYPFKYTIKTDNKSEDYILVYIFEGNKQTQQAIYDQHYTITSLTKFENFINKNVLVVYFAPSGDLDKYQKKLEAAVNQMDN